ncbi:hypothetical protein LCGC14_1062450 [marine sediment metagenome]|uniref:Uncharacterized protein n=1 Tax=marine sediment metagenome TaxID=412755 RepID=A0A0F9MKS3_9ZZZZ
MSFDLRDCVPRFSGEYMRDILAKYDHVVRIDAREMNLGALRPMEAWCEEHFGKLEEHTSDSPWQLSIDDEMIGKGTFVNVLCFHFHNEQFAMAFKLRWM